MPASSLCD